MKCSRCGKEVNNNDNYCFNCGSETTCGYTFLKNNTIEDGKARKKEKSVLSRVAMLCIIIVAFIIYSFLQGDNMYSPYIFFKKMILSNSKGYIITLVNNNNIYFSKEINDELNAKSIIRFDYDSQKGNCKYNKYVRNIEEQIEDNYDITSVNFCDVSLEEAQKMSNVIEGIYKKFPTIKGYLTNISITNDENKDTFVAYFQPKYQFVNNNQDNYNKVNKTQILFNSYYFLNDKLLENDMNDNYVKDATWESLIAHEFGHYISFVALLKQNNIDSIILETKYNENKIKEVINKYNDGILSKEIILKSLNNYNDKYNDNLTIDQFASKISLYSALKKNNEIIYDEVIAEAVHDYYLHDSNMNNCSKEIIKILKEML